MHYHVTYKVSSVPSAIRVKLISSCSVCLIFASKITTLCNYLNQFSLSFFLDFSHRQPPPVNDHFVVHQGSSLTRELTVFNTYDVTAAILMSQYTIKICGCNRKCKLFV